MNSKGAMSPCLEYLSLAKTKTLNWFSTHQYFLSDQWSK
jgi:hypothetical protein